MKTQFFIVLMIILTTLIIAGCSSLLTKDKADKIFSEFLRQKQHYALFSPASISSEEKLKHFGISDYGQRISRQYKIKDPVASVIETFVEAIPDVSRTIIVQAEKANDLLLPLDYPVLFFHSNWHLIYRRIPTSFSHNQLQVGIIGKIIPLGQVLSSHGPTALKTSSWEGKCFYKPFEGRYFALDEWEANNADLLHQGIKAAQDYCAAKFIHEFSNRLKI